MNEELICIECGWKESSHAIDGTIVDFNAVDGRRYICRGFRADTELVANHLCVCGHRRADHSLFGNNACLETECIETVRCREFRLQGRHNTDWDPKENKGWKRKDKTPVREPEFDWI